MPYKNEIKMIASVFGKKTSAQSIFFFKLIQCITNLEITQKSLPLNFCHSIHTDLIETKHAIFYQTHFFKTTILQRLSTLEFLIEYQEFFALYSKNSKVYWTTEKTNVKSAFISSQNWCRIHFYSNSNQVLLGKKWWRKKFNHVIDLVQINQFEMLNNKNDQRKLYQ